jgi:phage regulator Rha-like protein
MILRFYCRGEYKEIHVKVFNTGKLEIPGILNNDLLVTVQRMILEIIQPHVTTPLFYIDEDRGDENVLINSNFNCGFYIDREKTHLILRSEKYGIESAFDPCSYPGVKCKFYFNHELGFDVENQKGQVIQEDRQMKMSELIDNKKYTEISFMIFRTGSCLIVGNCSEKILMFVFEFIKRFLKGEYETIRVTNEGPVNKTKRTKIRKRDVQMTTEYYREVSQKCEASKSVER